MSYGINPQERFYRCLNKEKVDHPPVLAYHFLLPRGKSERELRNAGCVLIMGVPIYEIAFPPEITVEEKKTWKNGEALTIRTYSTPVGSLQEVFKIGPYGSEWKREHFIKQPQDYQTMTYLLEKAIFREKIADFLQTAQELGEDGVAVPMLPLFERSPFQKLLIDLAGPERTLLDLYDHPKDLEMFINCLCQKMEEAMHIYHSLPEKKLFWWVDNITSDFTSPRLFEQFCLPIYQKYLTPLRKEGITCMLHLDGKLSALKELISKAPIDVVESFTMPEQGGDLELEEAHKAWKDKVIAANIPANLAYRQEKEIAEFFENLMGRRCLKERFVLELSEDLPREHLGKVLSVLSKTLSNLQKGGE
ncbi:MAG: hypothetical protein PWP42_325 [Candidatus Atribacteria bacterium]|nr:hypothetical protein [Candidatus Atribacteria bacterium]